MKETYKVVYAPEALDDIMNIYSYISHKLKAGQTAKSQIERIRKEVRSLNSMPKRYIKVDWEPWASMQMHKMPVNNYVVYYSVDDINSIVTVIRVCYGGMNIKDVIQNQNNPLI